MRVGIDFDNTLISYDRLFYSAAVERGLVPAELQPTKQQVRAYLWERGRNDLWTELQGFVYGRAIKDAPAFPAARQTMAFLRENHVDFWVVSHKTRRPARGHANLNLHQAALEWLEANGFFAQHGPGLRRDRVYFETTRQDKLARIAQLSLSHFIDDLPEVFDEPHFPGGIVKMLFNPHGADHPPLAGREAFSSWPEMRERLERDLERESRGAAGA